MIGNWSFEFVCKMSSPCFRLGDQATKSAAYAAVPQVCRTASTLYDFVNYAKLINQVSRAPASL